MHDIRAIRESPERYAAAWSRRRGLDGAASVAELLALDAAARSAILEKEAAEATRNARSKEIGQAKAAKDEARASRLMTEVADAKTTIERAGKNEADAIAKRDDLLARLPNLPLDNVPDGADERANVEVRVVGDRRAFNFKPKDHADLGAALGMMDFEAAARISGARFVVLKGQLARLERALTAFMLDVQTGENGYAETAVPLLVQPRSMFGTGQLPKFEEDLFVAKTEEAIGPEEFEVEASPRGGSLGLTFKGPRAKELSAAYAANDGSLTAYVTPPGAEAGLKAAIRPVLVARRYLIPTAEVSLTNLVREHILDGADLPMRMTAATACFRSEAGSAGRDTKGMIRMHQFVKVELVSIVRPEEGAVELERMTSCAESVLQRLGLPFRTVMLCAGDMGFGARQTYDIEVWLPSQETYREISSCSYCGDFQARRMDARFRRKPGDKPEFVHTLNGSGLAVGRTLVAVLENYQQADGTIEVPTALRPYMGGLSLIGG